MPLPTPSHVIQYSIGEVITFKAKQCMINSITNPLGYDRFHLIDLANGDLLLASHFQLGKVQECVIDFDDDMDFDDAGPCEIQDTSHETGDIPFTCNPASVAPPHANYVDRFRQLSELEMLAAKRLSENTTAQTKWSVRTFKGAFLVEMKSLIVKRGQTELIKCTCVSVYFI